MTSLETAKMAVKALDSKKALDIKVIKIQDISAIADYFVIATGTSSTHVKALADEVEAQLDDYVDVVVHVFSDEAREYYDLERLWQDGEIIDIE